MTVTIKCQYTGIEFEAASTRAKNHPLVSRLLDQHRKDWKSFRGAGDALKDALNSTFGAYDTAEEAVESARANYLAWRDGQTSVYQQRKAEQQRLRERRAARAAQNELLRANGYTWHKNADDGYQPMFDNDDWNLVSTDGRIVSVAQALDEIERGTDVVLAEIAAKIAEEKAEEEAAAADAKAEIEFETAVTNATANLTRTSDRFDTLGLTTIARHGYRTLLVGEIDGQRVAAVELAMYDGEFYTYWSENGTAQEPPTIDDFWS